MGKEREGSSVIYGQSLKVSTWSYIDPEFDDVSTKPISNMVFPLIAIGHGFFSRSKPDGTSLCEC